MMKYTDIDFKKLRNDGNKNVDNLVNKKLVVNKRRKK